MKKNNLKLKILIISSVLFLGVLFSLPVYAVSLPWSTTFNCNEWLGYPNALSCDGLGFGGGYLCVPGGFPSSGNTTTLVDTSVNFVTNGIQVGDSLHYLEDRVGAWQTPITSISTTTNPNDTLHFATQSPAVSNSGLLHAYIIDPQDASLKKQELITSTANYSGGNGGKGQRHWLGDGENNNSGGTIIGFNTGQTEIWVRWYMRFQTGFAWAGYSGFKILYLLEPSRATLNYFMVAKGSNTFTYSTQVGDHLNWENTDAGWQQTFCGGGTTSDGSWHCIELHLKSETGVGTNDGILQWWADGVLKGNFNNVNHGFTSGGKTIGAILIGSNSKYPDNGLVPYYVDYDDIAISTTGYIGPISQTPDTTPPAAPTGVTVS